MRLAIFDLDNCLADDAHRIPMIDWKQTDIDKRYDRCHMFCGDDAPGNMSVLAAVCRGDVAPAFVTARPEGVRGTTRQWLNRHASVGLDNLGARLIMRDPQDKRSSPDMKGSVAYALLRSGHEIVAAFDDREDVLRAYRVLGIPAARLWIHEQCAMTPPQPGAVPLDPPRRYFHAGPLSLCEHCDRDARDHLFGVCPQ